jgi:glutamate synthase domain-containing protein 2
MNLSFLPGDLHLSKDKNGLFIVKIAGQEVLSTRSSRAAVAKFNALRSELEKKFPMAKANVKEKAELLRREICDALVSHNSLGRNKKRTTARGTRTFGG